MRLLKCNFSPSIDCRLFFFLFFSGFISCAFSNFVVRESNTCYSVLLPRGIRFGRRFNSVSQLMPILAFSPSFCLVLPNLGHFASLEFGCRVGGRDIVDTGGVQPIISIQLNTDQSNNAVCPSLILLSRRFDVAKNILQTCRL